MDPEYIAHLVMVGINEKSHTPSCPSQRPNVKDKFYELFRGQVGKGLERNEGIHGGEISE
jgi:hypothetical protein